MCGLGRTLGRASAENAIETALENMENEGLKELVELLRAQPRKILPVLRFAKNSMVGNTNDKGGEEGESDFYTTYRKI